MIPSISLAWPPKHAREHAAQTFADAVVQFESAVNAPLDGEGDGATAGGLGEEGSNGRGVAAQGAEIDAAQLWKEMVQNGAPQEVRANAWLTLAWARRCIRREEPRLFWAAVAAGGFVGSAWIYDLARSLAELLLN